MSSSAELQFNVKSWSAWSTSNSSREQWLAWAAGEQRSTDTSSPDVSFIPAMQRRRLSSLSKMVFATANECLEGVEQKPNLVFASRHGELTRTMKIINAIVSGSDVSPTDFSASVHNTALGLYSIFSENKNPSSMVVAGEHTFTAALLEACIYLQRFPTAPVLVCYFDEPLPAPLSEFETPEQESLCVALLLANSGGKAVNMSRIDLVQDKGHSENNEAKNFLKFFLAEADSQNEMATASGWRWSYQ